MTDAITVQQCPALQITIFMAGDADLAATICRTFCDEHGLCVTVTPTLYVYTGGQEEGFAIGLINYARFPKPPFLIEAMAVELAHELRLALGQESFTVQTPTNSIWYSWRRA